MLGGPYVFKAVPGNQCIYDVERAWMSFPLFFIIIIIFVFFFWFLYIHVIKLYMLVSKEVTDRQSSHQV